MRPPIAATLLLLGCLLLAAPSSAALVPVHNFAGEMAPANLLNEGGNQSKGQGDLLILTGKAHALGVVKGLFAFADVQNATLSGIARLEVYDSSGSPSSIDPEQFNATKRPVHRAFVAATMRMPANHTFVLHTDRTQWGYTTTSPFAFAMPLHPPKDLGGSKVNLTADRGLLLVGRDLDLEARLSVPHKDGALVYLSNDTATVRITSPTDTATFTGSKWVYKIYQAADLKAEARGLLLPFKGNASAQFTPVDGAALSRGFNLTLVNDVVRVLQDAQGKKSKDNKDAVPKDVIDSLGQVRSLLNGALVGRLNGTFQYAGRERDPGNFSLIRYDALTLEAGPQDLIMYDGKGAFLLVGDRLASTKSVVRVGSLPIPVLSLFLWVLAGGAIVAGFLLKPLAAAHQVGAFGTIRLLGWISHGLALVLLFLLWDAEIKRLLGTSLLTLFVQGAFGQAVALAIVGTFEVVPLLLALTYFGYPIRFIVNSGLKLGGLKKGRGVGKAVGDLAAWGLGAAFIPAFLNLVVGALVKGISGAF